MIPISDSRIRTLNDYSENNEGEYVLYWMISTRRPNFNAGLQRAVEIAKEFDKPLLVFEAISTQHKFANNRIMTFMVQGMNDNMKYFDSQQIRFIPWVETPLQPSNGILKRLSMRAVAVVTDDFPTYYPRMIVERIKHVIKVRFEAIDSNGLIPMSWATKAYPTAHSFRRHVHSRFVEAWGNLPNSNPIPKEHNFWMKDELFQSVLKTSKIKLTPLEWIWRVCQGGTIGEIALETLDIDHEVSAVGQIKGGHAKASENLQDFIVNRMTRYHLDRNSVDNPAVSGFSSWIHFGHISTIEIVQTILESVGWSPTMVDDNLRGRRSGWWGLSEPVEAFLDQIITWRELGFNFAFHRADYSSFTSIPDWAKKSLFEHRDDPREKYTFKELENAETHDELWNAAQRQLTRVGIIHNYLRMLWGKRILEWAPSPEIAADWMIQINDRWALDGRDPNSYTGIFWVLGRHDRAWGPERPIFGKIRYMSSKNTARKLNVRTYLERWAKESLLWDNLEVKQCIINV